MARTKKTKPPEAPPAEPAPQTTEPAADKPKKRKVKKEGLSIKVARGFRNAKVFARPGDVFTADQVGGEGEARWLIRQGLADEV